ncbi:AlpA family transcriptional regulator [Bradyrhizobium sp. AUGA SZCCT0160]|uniref:helix-turn-helix transcriptional regulator n=1 Tax=Bradyrhizobium sp. AUGA SZCCT0160 TaxID=2807662 RepID=UPI001BA8A4AF|nr:AlpA family phage regulatory protein [Bradyrhizobium sp. AUGA SZCCT0160]MBR1193976.1 AlpA family phage regulatory protein [Bradyrhizobium sp. AUGA SZCCT0160]
METLSEIELKPVQLMQVGDVLKLTRIGKSKLYTLLAAGEFPKPLKLGKQNLWLLREVHAHIEAAALARDGSPA